jgi:hyperosmotically inducible periplasmic protein
MKSTTLLRPTTLAIAAAAALTLAACDDNRTVGQQIDSGVAQAERKSEQVAANTREAANKAGNAVSEQVADASITTALNAEYAKDDKLSAIKIDVDTNDGRVTLTGSAPDAASKDRATMLANNVKGVKSVDNKLTVKP